MRFVSYEFLADAEPGDPAGLCPSLPLCAFSYHCSVLKTVRAYIRERELIGAGERVAVAVSGGADSVALLRVLLELRQELGIVLSVVHLNHQLRGAAAGEDARFVAELTAAHGLELHLAVRDVGACAAERKLSIEAAGRELRYGFFRELVEQGRVDKVATAHTLDDQAETVLLKLLRGSGLRGLAGIHDKLRFQGRAFVATDSEWKSTGSPGSAVPASPDPASGDAGVTTTGNPWVVRPLLGVTRAQVETYLRGLPQPWREDESNRDLRFTRNRVRKLLPQLQTEFNPALCSSLAQMAELAQAEECYWAEILAALAPGVIRPGEGCSVEVDCARAASFPLALQRRLLRFAAEGIGLTLGFDDVERLRLLLAAHSGTRVLLANGEASKQRTAAGSIIHLAHCAGVPEPGTPADTFTGYEYHLSIPGEVIVAEARCMIRASLVEVGQERDPGGLADPKLLGPELAVRNWRPGDRYLARGAEHEKKLKVYFQQYRIPLQKRTLWPLVFGNGRLVWAYGMPIALDFEFKQNTGVAVRIEGVPLGGCEKTDLGPGGTSRS